MGFDDATYRPCACCQAVWYQRIHALWRARGKTKCDALIAQRKRIYFESLQGNVLEIGPGTGPNLSYYPSDIQWIGIEPNQYMHPYLKQAAAQHKIQAQIHCATAEQLPNADASVDAVVSTMALCTVTRLADTFNEILRVLKPGGRFIFIEHVAAPNGTALRRIQNMAQPLWHVVYAGCYPNRELWTAIERAGFADVHLEHFRLPILVESPHIAGVAIKHG
ncbi:class I SAM-dependent methyltransferase [Gloeobacter violaceus]|uniref:Gll2671 protein n=1 Tax=Gloeobacter violaceus (strain ATCC 29082 / PCC 7421) TaxID=251221 RepID=Q7NH66_GLOVI|nr:class I SAM-dependent methyltransferase [Gloeobacter violaceus]BAC90612.1 gll2671 [Gloeobacter violaceus PCC 7421]